MKTNSDLGKPSMNTGHICFQIGVPETLRSDAVSLFEEAFGEKFSVAIPNRKKRLKVLSEGLNLDFSVAALTEGKLIGFAGFQLPNGSITSGITLKSLFRHLGVVGCFRAVAIFSLFHRKLKDSELLMDGIVVCQDFRGQGIGTKILETLKAYASTNDYSTIRLDVIDTNSNAKRLYDRFGFFASKTESFEFLRGLLGFGASTTMIYQLDAKKWPGN